MENCTTCKGEIVMGVISLERKHSSGVIVNVVNVPAGICNCEKYFELHHGVIIEDFIRNLKVPRVEVDFKEVQDAYQGISTMDIVEKRKNERGLQ